VDVKVTEETRDYREAGGAGDGDEQDEARADHPLKQWSVANLAFI
jgi:hypothetical protein